MQHLPTPAIQVPPGWPTAPATPTTGAVQLHTVQTGTVVYVPGPDGAMVAVLREHLPTTPAAYQSRDLTPQPLFDPRAQRIAAGGLLAGGAGWGAGQLLLGAGQLVSAAAGLGSLVMWAAIAVVASRIGSAVLGGGRPATVHNTTVHNRWFGRSAH
ncbi:hypothetical protein KZO11_27750 [Streptomyces anulatus]|uniref:hypothetical protein n=1 Tax=Streptomyces anulatus TaxID=1892 RepID=UPI001C5DD1F3|nr:hypothetical protein [Streptomyces anulatus]QYA97141.1 hypothetical protein KZO11_27750 [Streptomyces anulatus]